MDAHDDDVNAVAFADETSNILYSGSDDGMCKVCVDTQTDRHRQMDRQRHRDRETYCTVAVMTACARYVWTHRDTDKQTDTQTDGHTETQMDILYSGSDYGMCKVHGHTQRWTDGDTDRQRDRQTDRWTVQWE